MHVAAVIFSLHAIGQLWLDFEISIAQIAICLAVGAAMELAVVFGRERVIAWPGSGLLTANGVAFIFRVNGTEHGDWWSTRGWGLFAACVAVSVLSKYAVVVGDRHLFNPSNIGLVVCFLLFGTGRVNPLDFWWGPWSPALALAYAVILVGGLTLSRRIDLLPVVAAGWVALAAGLAVVAASGHAMDARWHVGPVTDWSFWWVVVTSPEVLVFVFFMVTDPRTVPRGRTAQVAFAITVGVSAALLAAPQQTEFATKVAVLAGLVVACALRPLFERAFPVPGTADDNPARWAGRHLLGLGGRGRRWAPVVTAAAVTVIGGVLVAVGSSAREPRVAAAVDVAVVAARPPVVLAADRMPTVTVADDARHLRSALDQDEAERLVADVLVDLEIEREAVRDRDLALAATAVAGPRLDAVAADLEAGLAGTVPQRPEVLAERAEVVAVRDPTNPQAVPSIGVRLEGLEVVASGDRPMLATYAVVEVDGVHLITDEIVG